MIWLLLTLWVLIVGTSAGFLLKKIFPWVGHILLALMILYGGIVAAGTVICWDEPEPLGVKTDCAVVLGCALKDGQATKELVRRCSTAKALMDLDKDLVLIVSGGDPGGQGRTEAEVMAAWLRNHGADADRILIENRASDTRENLLFSKALAEENGLRSDCITIVTSEYHQTRAQYLAGKLGQQATGFSCHTPMPDRLFAAVREAYAFLKAIVEM